MYKDFLLFVGDTYYWHDTLKEAITSGEEMIHSDDYAFYSWYHVVDMTKGEIVKEVRIK